MARKRYPNTALPTRLQGKVSGVTFMTNPSGVTIYKATVQCTTLTVAGAASGYYLPYATASGLKMTSGILACSGGSKARQSLGLSAIYNVFCSASSKFTVANVTGIAVVCSPEGTKSFGSGCTKVTFVPYKLNRAGVTFSSACSINYIALGT